jgi:hypothetical protein
MAVSRNVIVIPKLNESETIRVVKANLKYD